MKVYEIENAYQKLTILSIGATIHKWETFSDKQNIVISNKNIMDYPYPKYGFLSSTIGRVANRINKGKFNLNGKEYQLETNFAGQNHGHGGSKGFFAREFELLEHTNNSVKLMYKSLHEEAGYPGNLDVIVTYTINANKMKISFEAKTDQDTIVNLTNHAHFNLSNEDTILNHEITILAEDTLETDQYLVPTGKLLPVKNTILDLNKKVKLSNVVLNNAVQDKSSGLDHAFMLSVPNNQIELTYKNRKLLISTTYPCTQVFTMNVDLKQEFLDRSFKKHMGIAFECQFEPDAINHPTFSSIVLKKNETYFQETEYTISEDAK